MKSAAYLPEALLDPKLAFSQEPTETPLNVALKNDISMWDWLESEDNELRRIRFGMAMEGAKLAADPNAILDGLCRLLNKMRKLRVV